MRALAQQELAHVSGTDSAVSAVDQRVADVERQARQIQAVRGARAQLDALRNSPDATQQLAAATAAVSQAEAAAPPERDWPLLERSAAFNRAAAARHDRARVIDDQAIGRITDRITRLEEGLRNEQAILEQIDTEIVRRDKGGTPTDSHRIRHEPTPPPPSATPQPELDHTQRESGPDVEM